MRQRLLRLLVDQTPRHDQVLGHQLSQTLGQRPQVRANPSVELTGLDIHRKLRLHQLLELIPPQLTSVEPVIAPTRPLFPPRVPALLTSRVGPTVPDLPRRPILAIPISRLLVPRPIPSPAGTLPRVPPGPTLTLEPTPVTPVVPPEPTTVAAAVPAVSTTVTATVPAVPATVTAAVPAIATAVTTVVPAVPATVIATATPVVPPEATLASTVLPLVPTTILARSLLVLPRGTRVTTVGLLDIAPVALALV
ncbi:hypothetical protein [Crossiella sp. NPDC003009]